MGKLVVTIGLPENIDIEYDPDLLKKIEKAVRPVLEEMVKQQVLQHIDVGATYDQP